MYAFRSEARSAKLVEPSDAYLSSTLIGTYFWDIGADRVYSDKRVCAYFGRTPGEEARGVPLELYLGAIVDRDRERIRAAITDTVENGARYRQTYSILKSPGTVVTVLALGQCLRDEATGKPTIFFGHIIDLTMATSGTAFDAMLYQQAAALRMSAGDNGYGLIAHLLDMVMEELMPAQRNKKTLVRQ